MRLSKILRYQISTSLINMLLFSYDFDTTTTARSSGFHYVHMLKAFHLSFILPPFIVFWENVRCRRDIIILPVRSFHLEDISPKIILSTQVPRPWEMINLLILIDVLELVSFN